MYIIIPKNEYAVQLRLNKMNDFCSHSKFKLLNNRENIRKCENTKTVQKLRSTFW